MSKLTKQSAQAILSKRELISEPGRYRVKVNSATPYIREDGTDTVICNFNAMTSAHLKGWKDAEGNDVPGALTHFHNGDYDESCSINLSSSQRTGKDFIPNKGDRCYIDVDEVTTNNGVTGLFVVGVVPIEVSKAAKVSMSMFDMEKEPEADALVAPEEA